MLKVQEAADALLYLDHWLFEEKKFPLVTG
jgi:hypothetical protein